MRTNWTHKYINKVIPDKRNKLKNEIKEHHEMAKTILMKVTSRGRPTVLLNTIKLYYQFANNTNDMYWLLTFDWDDETVNEDLVDQLIDLIGRDKLFIKQTQVLNANKIEAINRDVNEFDQPWDILLNISDDQIPTLPGYDDVIRESMPHNLDASLWFHDGWQPRINTQEIVGRKYYERFNYIYYPEYKSFFCDNEATEVAQRLGKLLQSPKCIIKHYHPAWDKNSHIKRDALYIKNDTYWKHDEELFKKRKLNNYK
jgi:hypothetical protein